MTGHLSNSADAQEISPSDPLALERSDPQRPAGHPAASPPKVPVPGLYRGDQGKVQRLRSLLIRSLQDEAAARQLMIELYGWLERYYRRRLPPGAVDDAVQEAIISVYRHRASYDCERPFAAWLCAIARYKWIDQLRALRRNAAEILDDNASACDGDPDVLSTVSLDALLQTLRPAQALVIRLVKINGLTVAEAAAITGQSQALVKVNVHRGLARLKEMVAAE